MLKIHQLMEYALKLNEKFLTFVMFIPPTPQHLKKKKKSFY